MSRSVILFGDSITRGQFSASYVGLLGSHLNHEGYEFKNYGINNDTTYNLLRRIQHVIDCCPDFITVLIGTNDIIASLNKVNAAFYIITKLLPRQPTLEYSLANARRVIRRLKSETGAEIGLASIPMLGEDLESLANRKVQFYNDHLRKIARAEEVVYLPVYESLVQALNGIQGRKYDNSVPLTAEFILRHFLLKEDFNTFSDRKGFRLLIDGVHLNERGAEIVADVIQNFLRTQASLSRELIEKDTVLRVR